MSMVITFIELMGLVVFASILQKNFKIPSPITLMTTVFGAMALDLNLFKLDSEEFDTLVFLTLPLLIATDALKLKWEDLKTHGFSLFWVAFVSVLLAIGIGVFINDYILVDYTLSIAAVVLLFCMVSATDPITVSAIFANFKVPHKLKVLTEGESLFNDATALIVFSIALVALNKPDEVNLQFIGMKSAMVVFGAIAIGLVLGYLTTLILHLSEDAFVEATIIILSAYIAYFVSEHYHFSGILAIIVDVVIANKVIQKILKNEKEEIKKGSSKLLYKMTSKSNQSTIVNSIDFVAMFASASLFVSIAAIVDIDSLIHYKYEIVAIFLATTLIRALMMMKFAFVSNSTKHMHYIQKHWWAVLTFSGSKGALSILMVHMLPNTFEYKSLFETIIIGNILLSTFIYAFILALIIIKNKVKFEQECKEEVH